MDLNLQLKIDHDTRDFLFIKKYPYYIRIDEIYKIRFITLLILAHYFC